MQQRRGGGARRDFVILHDSEKEYLAARGIQPQRVPVRRGDVILWRSDLAHKGAPPIGRRDGFRAVVYICMLPAALTPEPVYEKKRRAYEQLETGGHWPCREEWFCARYPPLFELRPYFDRPPPLTARQRLLYGLVRYGAAAAAAAPLPPLVPELAPRGEAGSQGRARRWQQKAFCAVTEVEGEAPAGAVARSVGGGAAQEDLQKAIEEPQVRENVRGQEEGCGVASGAQ